MLDTVFLQVLDMTKTASIVILVVLLARLLLKKAPKTLSYALWVIVLFRLLSPWAMETPVSFLPRTEPVAENYTLAERQISPAGAAQAAYQAAGDLFNGGTGIQHIKTMETDEFGHPEYATSLWWEVWILFGKYLWLIGIAAMGIYSVLSYYKLRRKLVGAVNFRDNILLSDYIASPFVMGLLSPKIYLPSSLSEREREYIILHEQYHIKRLDHIIKALSFLALCIHWFNPLVWLAFVLSGKDMEMSCDEAVIRKMGTEIRADYCASLLSLATGWHIIAGMPLAFGEGNTKSRIKNLAHWKKPLLWIVLVAACGCILLAVCLLTNPMRKTDFFRCSNRHQVLDGYAIDFDLTLGNQVKSGVVYAEQWYKGECVKSSYALLTKEAKELHILMKLTREEDITSYERTNLQGVNIQIDSDKHGGSLLTYFALPEDQKFIGWSFVTYEPAEKKEIHPEDTSVLAAVAFDAGWGIRVFDCETLVTEPDRINESNYIIIIRSDFSDKDIPDSASEMASFSVAEPIQKKKLTIEDVITLAEKGEELTWADFEDYNYYDIGSGLIIQVYDIDEIYSLRVGGGGGSEKPMYIYLCSKLNPDAFLDIRTNDILKFIQENNVYAEIEAMLSVLSSPLLSFDEHLEEYNKLIAYREKTMAYCFKQFLQGEQPDLRASVMAGICRVIAGELGEELELQESLYANGQAWFDAFRERAQALAAEYSDAQLEQSYPASWLLLDIIEKDSM